MTTTQELQISQSNVRHIADQINAAVDGGRIVTVNGDTPIANYEHAAANAYMNGTLGYRVKAKAPGKTRELFVKIGHMVTITSDAPEDQANAPHAMVKPRKVKHPKVAFTEQPTTEQPDEQPTEQPTRAPRALGDRHPMVATIKGETGWLSVRTVNGKYAYAVTMDEKQATLFRAGGSRDRHAARATAAGITVDQPEGALAAA